MATTNTPRTKAGTFGTLYLFAVRYRDCVDRCCPTFTWRAWAYDAEHALDKFHSGPDADGWEPVGRPTRVAA